MTICFPYLLPHKKTNIVQASSAAVKQKHFGAGILATGVLILMF
jgi:hypothetical protein